MKKRASIVIIVTLIIIGVILGLVFGLGNKKEQTPTQQPAGQSSAKSPDNTQKPVNPGSYEIYSPEKITLANNGPVVLFFNARWCLECQKANKNFTNTGDFMGITIMNVDYDTYTDLKKKYKVTYQHTFVQVDAGGGLIKKWSGSYTLDDIKKQLGL